ncbi:MAG: methyltransferase domain-containing protein [Patescibacteria group bacterium]
MKNAKKPKGVMDISYFHGRETKLSLKYRLARRTKEVVQSIIKYHKSPEQILDLGTADGKMLSLIKNKLPKLNCVGLEYSKELAKANKDKKIKIFVGDVLKPPAAVKKKKHDVIIATAILEHVKSPKQFTKVCYQLLKKDGLVILTTPDPIWDKIATAVGHLPKEDHQFTLTIKQIIKLFEKAKFKTLEEKKFMFSPIGFPAEEEIEKILRFLNLEFLMANQLLVFKKTK